MAPSEKSLLQTNGPHRKEDPTYKGTYIYKDIYIQWAFTNKEPLQTRGLYRRCAISTDEGPLHYREGTPYIIYRQKTPYTQGASTEYCVQPLLDCRYLPNVMCSSSMLSLDYLTIQVPRKHFF